MWSKNSKDEYKEHSPSRVGLEGGPGHACTWHPERGAGLPGSSSDRPRRGKLAGHMAGRALPGWVSLPTCSTGQAEKLRLIVWPA